MNFIHRKCCLKGLKSMDQESFNSRVVDVCSAQSDVTFFKAVEDLHKITLDCSVIVV